MSVVEAATAVLRCGLPGQPAVPRSVIDVILGTPSGDLGRLRPQERAACVAALVWCLVQSGQAQAAADLADREGMPLLRRVAVTAPAQTQSACYAVLAEAYLSVGRCRDSTDCARIALDYATESGNDAHRFRTLGLLTASLVENGEFSAASDLLAVADDIGAGHDWGAEKWPLVLARVLINYRRGDPEGIQVALDSFEWSDSDDVVERAVSQIGLIWLHVAREEYRELLVVADKVVRGADRHCCPPFLRDQAVYMKALTLIHLGDPGAALRSLAGRRSQPEHPVCFELMLATVHLRLGEPRKALQVTEACVGNCPDHNLRTLPSVYFRRAVAYELLGHHDPADAEFSRAAHLAADLGGISPVLGLPVSAVERLYLRLMRDEPELGRLITARIPGTGYPAPKALGFVPPQLTEREVVLAPLLATDLTLAGIADRLKVSINTVKTQTRTLYRKLEVSGRAEAVDSLEQAGFFVNPPGPVSAGQ
ncbi:LuxR C-terminal-related transcriptional regulator [Raineyella sp. W15-4]|uniref:LuxR C-terminal-related transcriptional regulator n=1 Tax=Raineyella sp. W15-4 TaxID=3081651 RepID=UPI002954FE34|nr:LuxR C-terminal-related transcriptional regulator [Raineyella sp. W15-4]WOQ16885.1 LuxR C-terminal-related transcriptional regulator [Raineyella sp. W15-4]